MWFYFLLYIFSCTASALHTGTISLTIQNIDSSKGSIKVAIFDSESTFLKDDKAVWTHSGEIDHLGELRLFIRDLPYGTYAIAVFHDVNNNGKLDTNFLGIPKEPYGFSNNISSKWGSPKYELTHFELSQSLLNEKVEIKKWSEW